MDWLWTWGGKCFGYRQGDALFAYYCLQIGKFYGDEVYAADGRYLGEVMNENRLITHRGKVGYRQAGFGPMRNGSYARYANYADYAMYAGYEEFPGPDSFK